MLTAVILTFNEENIIGNCLKALDFVDRKVIVDSGSQDRTLEIARSLGAEIHYHEFEDYAKQRNFALKLVESGWIVMVDADEIVPPQLAQEIMEFVNSEKGEAHGMALVRRKDFFHGVWLKRAGLYPTWLPRLMKAGEVDVVRSINEQYLSTSPTCSLEGHLDHYPFNKGVEWWHIRHVRYAKMEAALLLSRKRETLSTLLVQTINSDFTKRRAALKDLSFRIPFRSTLLWLYLVFIRRGFLDGNPGMLYISMRLSYEKMIQSFYKDGILLGEKEI